MEPTVGMLKAAGTWLVTRPLAWLKRKFQKEVDIRFVCTTAALALDDYVRASVAMAYSTGRGEDSPFRGKPTPPKLSIDLRTLEVQVLNGALMYALLALPDTVSMEEKKLANLAEYNDNNDDFDYYRERQGVYVKLADIAFKLSQDLRAYAKLPATNEPTEKAIEFIRKKAAQLNAEREEQEVALQAIQALRAARAKQAAAPESERF